MFYLQNGKAALTPFCVTYEKTARKLVREAHTDPETGKFVRAAFETEKAPARDFFADAEQAAAYAEKVGGTVEDLTPSEAVVNALEHMTFASFEEARAFIEDGVQPPQKATAEGLSEILNTILGVADNG
jgi:hypothetical protein